MTKTDKETSQRPNWRYSKGFTMEKYYHRCFRDDELGAQMEVITKRKNGAPVGHGELYFYIDGDKSEFRTEEAMMKALEQRA